MKLGCGPPMVPLTLLDLRCWTHPITFRRLCFDEFKERRFRGATVAEAHGGGGLEREKVGGGGIFNDYSTRRNRRP